MPIRVVDFSHLSAVMIVSAALRRAWLIDSSDLVPAENSEGAPQSPPIGKLFRQVFQKLTNFPPHDQVGDSIWKSRAAFVLLDPLREESNQDVPDTFFTPWRHEVYGMYNHVFEDVRETLHYELGSGIGEFKLPNTSVMVLEASKTDMFEKHHILVTDTFIYPVWIAPGTTLALSIDGIERSFGPDGDTWTYSLWLREGKTVTITTKHATGQRPNGVLAVLVLGRCEPKTPPPLAVVEDDDLGRPSLEVLEEQTTKESDIDADSEESENWPEADHLARAIFLKGAGAVEHCNFDNEYAGLKEEEDRYEMTLEQTESNPDGQSPQESASLYKPLVGQDSFRILIIEPATSIDEDLRTRLITASLNSSPPYEAISYTWGDLSDTVPLNCNGAIVSIPRNLESGLKRLRLSTRPRYVWADSVCTNQKDVPERSQQVSIMSQIYQTAERVLVWLGVDEHDQAYEAFSSVCRIVRAWRPAGNRLKFSTYANFFYPADPEAFRFVLGAIDRPSWEALRSMFEVNYFRRFWIIQELALGSSAVVLWGKHHISWDLIGICSAWILTSGWNLTGYGAPITAAYNAFLIYVLPIAEWSGISTFSKLDLSVMLGATMGRFDSTDARDRIYALLGMPLSGNNPGIEPLMEPDYGTDVRSVYTHSARRILEHDRHLRMLSVVQHGPEIDLSYPTWVPRWDQPFHAEPIALREELGYYANGGELFCPSADTFSSNGECLIVTGLLCHTIAEVSVQLEKGRMCPCAMDQPSHEKAMINIFTELNTEGNQYRTSWNTNLERFTLFSSSKPEEQARLIATNSFLVAVSTAVPGKYGMRDFTESLHGERAQADHLGEFLLYWRERSSWQAAELQHKCISPFWEPLEESRRMSDKERALCSMNTLVGRRIFLSQDGIEGLGPAATRPGDVVAVLFGGLVPFVLRPFEGPQGEKSWRLVGECFVPSLMQGEAVEEAGLLADGTYYRSNGVLRLNQMSSQSDPRASRKVGDKGVCAFKIY